MDTPGLHSERPLSQFPGFIEAMNDLYQGELRLWLNLFLPSVKLLKKVRVGSKVRRIYDGPRTPLERVRACAEADQQKIAELEALGKRLDPFQAARTIEHKLERIYRMAESERGENSVA